MKFATLTLPLIIVTAPLQAASITIVNPSFQDDVFGIFPGYLGGGNPVAINGWTAAGGAGINGNDIGASTPFADNGAIPDASRVAFIQGAGSLSQTVSGLTPGKQYWLQGFINSRGPGASGIPAASVSFGGVPLVTNQPVPPVGGVNPYYRVNLPFTAAASSGSIMITSTPISGDTALVIDGLSLIQRDANEITIFNPSFEASGSTIAGVGYLNNIAGWTLSGQAAINQSGGAFNQSGFVPEGLDFAILQNAGTLSQQLSGVTPGQTYRLSLDYYGRDPGANPTGLITIDGKTAFSGVIPSSGGQLTLNYDFVASSANPTIAIQNLGVGADTSIFFDNVSLRAIPEPGTSALALLSGMMLMRRRRA